MTRDNVTKYYHREKIDDKDLTEIPLNRENWFYVMLDSSIRTAFLKYDIPLPKYVIIHIINKHASITIYRQDLENIKQAEKWEQYRIYVMDELRIQAEANSYEDYDNDENNMKYEFIII